MAKTRAVLLLLPLFAQCGEHDASAQPAMVFAAASLTAPFQEMARAFERTPGRRLELHFAGTPQLVIQVKEGAIADVFAAADMANMRKVTAAGQTGSEPRIFAKNELAIATAPGLQRAAPVRLLFRLCLDSLLFGTPVRSRW